jgi:hypothetical protein
MNMGLRKEMQRVCAREETRDFGMFFHSFEDWVTGADVCRTCRTHSLTPFEIMEHNLHAEKIRGYLVKRQQRRISILDRSRDASFARSRCPRSARWTRGTAQRGTRLVSGKACGEWRLRTGEEQRNSSARNADADLPLSEPVASWKALENSRE